MNSESLSTICNGMVEFFKCLKPSYMEQWLLSLGAVIGAGINLALGGVDKTIWALVALVIADYATGVFAACKTGQWDSSTGFVGLAKKATIFLIVAMCHWADEAIKTDLLRQMAVCAYALNELGSNLENIDKAGYGGIIPAGVRKMLARLRAKTENGALPLDEEEKHVRH